VAAAGTLPVPISRKGDDVQLYESKYIVRGVNIPAWSETFAGQDGCATTVCTCTGSTRTANPGVQRFYDPSPPEVFVRSRSEKGRRSGYPPFGMTPYTVSNILTRNYLTRRSNGSNAEIQHKRFAHKRKVGGVCTVVVDKYEHVGPQWVEWEDVTHLPTGSEHIVSQFDMGEITDLEATLQDQLSTRALTSFDALTEIAEAREIPDLVRSVSKDILSILRNLNGRFSSSDLRRGAYYTIRRLVKNPSRALRKLGKEWMQYRYAIMPLVYSYRDAMKTLRRGVDNTSRRSGTVCPKATGVTLPASTVDYWWKETVGTIDVRGTVFQHFDFTSAARLSGLGFNPLATAWELIPYSFVLDWFVNVGDYIIRKTSFDYSKACFACISRRSNYKVRTWQHFKGEDISLTPYRLPGTWSASDLPAETPVVISRPEESQLLQEVVTNSYSRVLFRLDDAQLRFSPSVNWKRMIDSAAMANNRLGGLISRLIWGR